MRYFEIGIIIIIPFTTSRSKRPLLERIEGMRSPRGGVDREHHAFAAMAGLAAIEPQWVLRLHTNRDDLLHGMDGVYGLEA
jgi:hypothetical protein